LEKIKADFKVIFVTAFDSHAIRAFEVNALDYLLKPVNPERLARALERLAEKVITPQLEPSSANDAAIGQTARKLEYEDRLFIEVDERSRFVKIDTIVCITAAGDYSEIFTSDGQ